MKNKKMILSMIAAMGGGMVPNGLVDKRSKSEKPNSDRIRGLSLDDLQAYREVPKNQRRQAMKELRSKYGVAV